MTSNKSEQVVTRIGAWGTLQKVTNVPLVRDKPGSERLFTAHTTGAPDTAFSVPAKISCKGEWVKGYLGCDDGEWYFVPHSSGKNYDTLWEVYTSEDGKEYLWFDYSCLYAATMHVQPNVLIEFYTDDKREETQYGRVMTRVFKNGVGEEYVEPMFGVYVLGFNLGHLMYRHVSLKNIKTTLEKSPKLMAFFMQDEWPDAAEVKRWSDNGSLNERYIDNPC